MKSSSWATSCVVALLAAPPAATAQDLTTYVRFEYQSQVAYGVLEGESIHELAGDLFADARPTGRTIRLSDARLLAPDRRIVRTTR